MLNQRKILRVLQFISYSELRQPMTVNKLAEMWETNERIEYLDYNGKPVKKSKKFLNQVPDVFNFSNIETTDSIDLKKQSYICLA